MMRVSELAAVALCAAVACTVPVAPEEEAPEGKPDVQVRRHVPEGCQAVGTQWKEAKYRGQAVSVPQAIRHERTGIELVLIAPGSYWRGASEGDGEAQDDEKPRHKVTLTQAFYLGKYEVTNAQYRQFRADHDSGELKGLSLNGASQPVVRVSWEDAQAFCERFGFRLPTEAEWEYACRAGTTGARYGELDAIAWHGEDWETGHHAVGGKRANAWGLHDMIGNVWEWCEDRYGSDEYSRCGSGVTDPTGPTSGDYRVLRGGSWGNGPGLCRSFRRSRLAPAFRLDDAGFRVARAL
ncbi:MAG: formylglycine-generating enzyme family protein [Planctomycetes bacterium]|nr:formylglycine-generating enzyme family protein [Planctomycetota bacterium]